MVSTVQSHSLRIQEDAGIKARFLLIETVVDVPSDKSMLVLLKHTLLFINMVDAVMGFELAVNAVQITV